MSKLHPFLKKRWKPPYKLLKYALLCIYLVSACVITVNAQTESGDTNDDIVVNVEAKPFSIRFFIDGDKYELVSVTCKTLLGEVEGDVEGFECINLKPCTKYIGDLKLKNETVDEISLDKSVATEYAAPKTIMNEPIPLQEEIRVSWKSINPSCIKDYKVSAISSVHSTDSTQQNDEIAKNMTGLKPCIDYNITLETFDINKVVTSVTWNVTRTLYAEPIMSNATITTQEVSSTQVKVTWNTPLYATCINYYSIKWFLNDCSETNQDSASEGRGISADYIRNNNMSTEIVVTTSLPPVVEADTCVSTANITNPNAIEYVMNDLKGCENYDLKIYINTNETAKSDPHGFASPVQAPGKVTVNEHELNATDVTLKWNQPIVNTKCVQFYQISITGPMQKPREEQTTSETRTTDRFETVAKFNRLFPCGNYEYTITGVSLNGTNGTPLSLTLDTLEAKPTPVRNYKVIEEPHNITISWEPPDFAELCLNGYRLTVWRDNSNQSIYDKETNDTQHTIPDLNACQTYSVQIIARTRSMDDGLPQQIDVETKPIIAQPPKEVQASSTYPHSLEISAITTDLNNNCETIFARFTCETSKSDAIYKKAERYIERGQVGQLTFKALLGPLSPLTDYRCSVALLNIAGWSDTKSAVLKTEPYFSDPPESVGLKNSTNVSLKYSWKAPKYANGNIKLYLSYLQRVEAAYFVPRNCPAIIVEDKHKQSNSLEELYDGLYPYTTYSIQIAAQNEYGVGEYTMPFMTKTEPSVSDPISILEVSINGPYGSATEYKANVVVSWTSPCKSNGQIEHYLLEFEGERIGYGKQIFTSEVTPSYDEYGHMAHNETRLKPEFNYTVTVTVKTYNVAQVSYAKTKTFDAPSGIPEALDEIYVAKATVDAYAANNPTNSAKVRFPADILDSESGKIVYIALLLSEKNCNPEPALRYGALNAAQEWPETRTWNDVYDEEHKSCIEQYQSTPLHWYPSRSNNYSNKNDNIYYLRTNEMIEYTIGTEKCEDTIRYCNGPLKPDTEYYLVLRLFTKSGYNDAAVLQFKTDSLIQLTIILVSVIGCLLFAFIVGFIYLWVTKRIVWKRESLHGIEDSFGDTLAKNFAIFYRDVSKPEKIHREFKELTVVAMDLSYTASELGCNKNRYADIFPYDKNRVILDIDAEGSDYINASFIDGYRRKKEYIATQGPKPESVLDFWRMILQHNVRVIVMVTQFREGDVIKCHEYFPYTSKSINVTVKRKECFEIYDRTEMSLTHDKYGVKQKVMHFYFKKWPDHGCPTDPNHLITFVRKVKAEKVPSYSPIVVHCSAGVGRTGTFIGLDIIMQRIRNESKINIYETVKKLRFQRMKMVQTLAQYTFLYACAYELVKHKNTRAALKYQKPSNTKKVSFEDDPENNRVNSLPPAPPLKFTGRRNNSDLSSVNELDVYDDDDSGVGASKASSYGSILIRFNGYNNKGGSDTYDESHTDRDIDSAKVRSNESVM